MTPETEPIAANLRPFWGRVLVIPSGVEEHERPSGLVVPHQYEGDEKVKRGVVLHIDPWRGEPIASAEDIFPGTIVYYLGGVRVLDTVVLERNEILAYEVGE